MDLELTCLYQRVVHYKNGFRVVLHLNSIVCSLSFHGLQFQLFYWALFS